MTYQRTRTFKSESSPAQARSSAFAPRPFPELAKKRSGSPPGLVQRAIGEGGEALIGKKAKMPGKAPWDIINVKNPGKDIEYQLSMQGLIKKWVRGDDDAWTLFEEEAPDQELVTQIEQGLKAGVAADISTWSGKAVFVAQSTWSTSTGEEPIIWSGGAADCVIVAGVTGNGQVFLAHVDRLSRSDGAMIISKGKGRVILASTAFSTKGKGADNANVQYLMEQCAKYKVGPEIYASRQLAVDSETGEISTAFEPPAVKADVYAEALSNSKAKE
jgi:hypothetical protein